MKTIACWLLLFTTTQLTTTLPAQKMLLPDGSGRQLQLFDLWSLDPDLAKAHGTGEAGAERTSLADDDLGAFLRAFLVPPLTAEDGITTLGGRWLAVLASPEQIAGIDRLLTLGKLHHRDAIDIEVRLLRVEDKAFNELLRPKLVANQHDDRMTFESVLPGKQATELLEQLVKSNAEQLDAPRLTTLPLQRAEISMVNQTSYVKDFTVTRNGDQLIADPIVDVVWDGVRSSVRATFLPDGMLGVACDVQSQELERPIASFETTLTTTTKPVTIQLPRITGIRLQQTASIGDGDAVVLGAQRIDGSFLVAIVMAKALPQPK